MESGLSESVCYGHRLVNLDDVTLCLSKVYVSIDSPFLDVYRKHVMNFSIYIMPSSLYKGYRDLLKLADNFAAFKQQLQYAHYRLLVSVKSDPTSWWKYACKTEVKFLGKSSHSNVLKLLGYCWEDQQFCLVYEYLQKRSLDTHLFRARDGEQLSWETRHKILVGAAEGLAYLHTEKNVIHRDFKTANVLLDGEFNAKVSDLSLAKSGPTNGYSHVSTVVGTYGYAAPEYIATGNLYVKSDVYNFGIELLEILTGRRVIDRTRPRDEQNLVEWASPYLHKKGTFKRIMDPRLEKRYPIKAAYKAAALVLKCLVHSPKDRPSMNEVLNTLEHIKTIFKSAASTMDG